MEHDLCYARNGIAMNTDPSDCRKQECDRKLCRCMRQVPGDSLSSYGRIYRRGASRWFSCN